MDHFVLEARERAVGTQRRVVHFMEIRVRAYAIGGHTTCVPW